MAQQPRATSFAHLVAPGAPKATKAEDDDAKKAEEKEVKQAEDEGDDEDAKKAEEPDDKEKGKKARKAKKAKREDEDEDGDNDENEEGDDDDDREEMQTSHASRAARLRERARCAAIFSDPAAAHNPALAAQLAFGTSLPRSEAVAVLRAGGAGAKSSRLADRMAGVTIPPVGADAPAAAGKTGPEAIAAGIVKLYEQARGLTPAKK